MRIFENSVKYILGLCIVLALRVVPHPPNVEPVMSVMMPFAKKSGWFAGCTFSAFSIFIYDIFTGNFGIWSVVTAVTYAIVGACIGIYLRQRTNHTQWDYIICAVTGTIVYDVVTGVGMGVLLFNQPLIQSFIGQIPFTIYHLAGNVIGAYMVSPLVYRWIANNSAFETSTLVRRFHTT